MDELPVRPLPRQKTLALLVGRVTTIKLAYWAAITVGEILIPELFNRPFAERFRVSVGLTVLTTAFVLVWSSYQARAIDRRAGGIARSIPTIATAFATASVVAAPAFIPLLLIERARSVEDCAAGTSCHLEALALWGAVFVIGVIAIPAVFSVSLRRARSTA